MVTISDLSKFRCIILCTLGTKDYGTAGIYSSVIIPYNYLKNSIAGHVASFYYNSNNRHSYIQYVSDTSLKVYTSTIGLIYGIK